MNNSVQNVDLSMGLYKRIANLYKVINPAGIAVEKIVAQPGRVTVQLEDCEAVYRLWPQAECWKVGSRSWCEVNDCNCRIVWEVKSDDEDH